MNMYTTRRNLIVFILVAISIGWIGIGIDKLIEDQRQDETLGMAIWLIVPLLLIINLRTFFGDGWKDAGLKPYFKRGWFWYLVAFATFPIVTAIVLGLGYLIGWIDFSNFDVTVFGQVFVNLLGVNIIKNIFEESVWRGYLTSKLVNLKLNDIMIYCIAGLIWGLWHAPYYMHFLSEDIIQKVLPVSRLNFLVVAMINMLFWTVLFTELYRLTKSIWPVILLHAVEDALINHLIIDGHIWIIEGKEILISPICGFIPAILYLGVGLWMRSIRQKLIEVA